MVPDVLGWYKRHWHCGEQVLGIAVASELVGVAGSWCSRSGARKCRCPSGRAAGDRSIRTKLRDLTSNLSNNKCLVEGSLLGGET